MASSKAGADLGFGREPAIDVAAAIVEGIEADALEVARGGEARAQVITLNRENPLVLDERFLGIKGRAGRCYSQPQGSLTRSSAISAFLAFEVPGRSAERTRQRVDRQEDYP
jgi:hypothetical protein